MLSRPSQKQSTEAPRFLPSSGTGLALLGLWVLLLVAFNAHGEMRFPPPDFESGHVLPQMQNPVPRSMWMEYFDVLMLAATLGVATWLAFRKRSRRGMFWLSVFAVLYFGFYREGCVCAIGSIQNVALGLFQNGYALPFGVMAFFILPLATALFFGRTFCSGVCPHGALQDLLLVKPVNLPRWLERGLGSVPFVYLGLAVLFAATGSTFVICRFDPFIPIFRISGSFATLSLAAAFAVAALFIGRPYCRFLCPYGALLKLASGVSRWRIRVTPDVCTECKLCADACPFGVITSPTPSTIATRNRSGERRRFIALLALLPALMMAGVLLGPRFGEWASKVNPDVQLASQYVARENGATVELPTKPDVLAMDRAERTAETLLPAAERAVKRFRIGGALFGAWVGLVIGARLIAFALERRRTDYEPERAGCFACARCFRYCPQERLRLGLAPEAAPAEVAPRPT